MAELTIRTASKEETRELGVRLGQVLPGNTVIAATGELGSGKTVLASGIAEGLAIKEQILSPTYIYYQQYEGSRPFYHIDAYRLEGYSTEELQELGVEECFREGACVFAEWPQFIAELLPDDTIQLNISYGDNPDERILSFSYDDTIQPWLKEVLA